jgi:hypothetical protein
MTTINDDFIERSADIRWPDGFDPAHADLFAHNAVVINAPAKSIWATLIAGAAWPKWYSNASDVVINDPSAQLGEDVTFDWTTFGLKIASKVAEFAPYERLGWYGNGGQLRAYHTWLIIPRCGDSTYVVMEEIGMGDGARHLAQTNPGHMHRGHDLWNISLKFACET